MTDDAVVVLNADGTYADASTAALAILGVTLEQLLATPPGAFSPQPPDPAEQAAFRAAWEASGSPDLGGEATLKRPDGRLVRVRFMIHKRDDGRFAAVLREARQPTDRPAKVFTLGEVLAAWRAAERQLEVLPQGSREETRIRAEVARLRDQYQRLFESKQRQAPPDDLVESARRPDS